MIDELAETPLEEVPADSRFLLEINFGNLNRSHIENQQYWIVAIQAAISAGQKSRAEGRRVRRVRSNVNRKLPSRTKLGITKVERQIQRDGMHLAIADDNPFPVHTPTISTFLTKRPHPADTFTQSSSNKRLCKLD